MSAESARFETDRYVIVGGYDVEERNRLGGRKTRHDKALKIIELRKEEAVVYPCDVEPPTDVGRE